MSDDTGQDKELQRRRLIEEIRRRAEEAELKRIEDGERTAGGSPPPDPPAPVSPPAPVLSPLAQRLADLVQRTEIALDRGLAGKADTLLAELRGLPVDPVVLAALEERRTALGPPPSAEPPAAPPESPTPSVPAPEPAPPPRPGSRKREDAPRTKAQRDSQKRKIGELLEKANAEYQHEHYDAARGALEEILTLDPEHADARVLAEAVEKASRLAEELRIEEQRRREALAATQKAAAAPRPAAPKDAGDPWGDTPMVTTTQTVFEDPEEKKQKIQAQKPALLDQMTEKVARVRVPVKPLITGALGLVLILAAWFIIDAIRTTVFPPRASLLVFPATGSVTDGSQDYLTEGLTEGLIREFTRIDDMHLIAPATALRYLDPRMHTARTAMLHGVGFYMTWTIAVQGEDLTVQASLYDTAEARPRWSTRLTRSFREVPALRQELALAVLGQMQVELGDDVRARFRGRGPAVPEALTMELRARYLLNHLEEGEMDSAVAEFNRARIMDSTSADAWSGLGLAHIRSFEEGRDTAGGHLTAALRCVQEAVRRDPSSAEASMIWALVHHYQGDNDRAVARMDEARALAPSDARVLRRLAVLLAAGGKVEDAVDAAETARLLDPFNEKTATVAGLVRTYLGALRTGDPAEAMAEFRAAAVHFLAGSRLAPDRSAYAARHLAETFVYLQMPDSALAILTDRVAEARESYADHYRLARVLQSAGKPVPQWQGTLRRAEELIGSVLAATPDDAAALATLALVRTRLGEFRPAALAGDSARALAPHDHIILYAAARVHALQRNREQALEALRRAIEVRYDLVEVMDMDFYTLRSDPDFIAAISR
jgi:tetratricopeptide (TPR) repeat protein